MARRAGQIIENARLHQQLRQSEARFRVALEHANIAVVENDLERRIRWIYNTRLACSPTALIGKTASEIFGPETRRLDELKRRVIETGEGARSDLQSRSTASGATSRSAMSRCATSEGSSGSPAPPST